MTDAGWKPIETAPTDGTRILVWYAYRQVIAWSYGGFGWSTNDEEFSCLGIDTPEIWHPLPENPL